MRIGPKVWFNAYYTFFYDFYLDGGFLSVGLESFIFGIMSSRSIFRMNKQKNDVEAQCKGLLMCIVLFMGIIRWQFISPTFVFSYIYLFLIFHFPIVIKIRNSRCQ